MDLFKSPEFESRVQDLMAEKHVPGFAIAIVQNDVIASAAYGHASLDPPKPCTPDTLFDIASASKSMTAGSVALLVADNAKHPEIKWDAKMSKLLPEDFVMSEEEYTKDITVDDILGHRTGLPRHDFSYLSPRAARPDDARSVTRNLRNLPVAAPVRSKFMYNNIMYTVATHLVESATGVSFPDFLQERFFGPLQMSSSNLQPERARAAGLGDRIATGHGWNKEKECYFGFQTPDCPDSQGAGSIMTSVNDYVKWVKAMMNREDPVTEEVFKSLVKGRIITQPDSENLEPYTSPCFYNAGLETMYYRGHRIIHHSGGVSGFGTFHFFLPELKFGGVLFGNSGSAGDVANYLARELIDETMKVPKDERPDWVKFWEELDRVENEKEKDEPEKLRQELCPGIKDAEPQKIPLYAYTGNYWNPGYHNLTVQVKDDKLFVDATDRSMGFTLTFDHVCGQTKYIVHQSDFLDPDDILVKAEFRFDNERVTKMGIRFESDYDDYIWFHKEQENNSADR